MIFGDPARFDEIFGRRDSLRCGVDGARGRLANAVSVGWWFAWKDEMGHFRGFVAHVCRHVLCYPWCAPTNCTEDGIENNKG